MVNMEVPNWACLAIKGWAQLPGGLPTVLCFPSLDTWPLSACISLSQPVLGQAALGLRELIG